MKTVPFTAAHTYMAHIWQYPPPRALMKQCLQSFNTVLKVLGRTETHFHPSHWMRVKFSWKRGPKHNNIIMPINYYFTIISLCIDKIKTLKKDLNIWTIMLLFIFKLNSFLFPNYNTLSYQAKLVRNNRILPIKGKFNKAH